MKAIPCRNVAGEGYVPCEAGEATHLRLRLPEVSPAPELHLPILPNGANGWTWNGDTEKPTLQPSVLVTGTIPLSDEQYDRIVAGEKLPPNPEYRCHSWITDGNAVFLGDCTHEGANQTIPLPDIKP